MRPALAFALALALSGCGEVTEIFACYSSDPSLAGRVLIDLVVIASDGRPLYASPISTPTDAVVSQGFVQAEADGVVIALNAAVDEPDPDMPGETIRVASAQVARVDFQPGRIVDVTLWVEPSCLGVVCTTGQTCVSGECLPETIAPECLADHGSAAPVTCRDGRVRRGCRVADGTL